MRGGRQVDGSGKGLKKNKFKDEGSTTIQADAMGAVSDVNADKRLGRPVREENVMCYKEV